MGTSTAAAGAGQQQASALNMLVAAAAGANQRGRTAAADAGRQSKGQGKGGRGKGKVCVPCTLKLLNITSTEAAKYNDNAVAITGDHKKKCPFCKCTNCKKEFTHVTADWRKLLTPEQCKAKKGST